MSAEPTIEIANEGVTVRHGGETAAEVTVAQLVETIDLAGGHRPQCLVLPRHVRCWWERRGAVAMAIEVPPHARTVRWLCDDSPAPFGPGAKYRDAFLAFPWVVILLVARGGRLTGHQQLYYRRESLDAGEELLLPNLYNVAEGYGQRCWLCLAQLGDLRDADWPRKVETVIEHVFQAAFNKSSEEHEGNSYWGAMKELDPRVASVEAWAAATRENRFFALDVPWRDAGTTVSRELETMLDAVVAPRQLETATDLAGLVPLARRRGRRRARRASGAASGASAVSGESEEGAVIEGGEAF